MKISLALGPRQPLSLQTAWGCLTSNLAVPGSGSLLAGRASGYGQLTLAIAGFILTIVFGLRFILWYFANRSRLQDVQTDPILALTDLWLAARWVLAAMGLFAFGWLWALATSFEIVRAAKNEAPSDEPPILDQSAPPRSRS